MVVICKKQTKRTVKGLKYEADALWNSPNNRHKRGGSGVIRIEGIGTFSVKNFTTSSGNEIPTIDFDNRNLSFINTKITDISVGEILVCISHYKTMALGGFYKVETIISKDVPGYNGQIYKSHYIKFEGISRSLKFSPYSFRKLTQQEQRDMAINNVFDVDANIIKHTKINKLEFLENPNLILIKSLSKSIIDSNRHHLSILDWACQKNSDIKISPSDYNELLEMPLKDILNLIETKQ